MGLLLHHAHTPPTPPSARTELPIPAALDQLVMSCLAKDPAERPQIGPGVVAAARRDLEGARRLDPGPGAGLVGGTAARTRQLEPWLELEPPHPPL